MRQVPISIMSKEHICKKCITRKRICSEVTVGSTLRQFSVHTLLNLYSLYLGRSYCGCRSQKMSFGTKHWVGKVCIVVRALDCTVAPNDFVYIQTLSSFK